MTDFPTLMCEHMAGLRKYARFLAGTNDAADDLMQDTWVRALEKQHLYQPDTNLRAWLFTMMRNLFMDGRRTAKRHTRLKEMERVNIITGRRHIPANQEHRMVLQDAMKILNAMPSELRTAVMDHIIAVPYQLRAMRHEIAVGTVKSRLSRAKDELEKRLDPPDIAGLQIEIALRRREMIRERAA